MYNEDRDFYTGERRPSLFSFMAVALLGAIIGGLMVAFLSPFLTGSPTDINNRGFDKSPPPIVSNKESSVVEIAEKLSPTVVGISNRVDVSRFFTHQRVERGAGSGVILDKEGYIVTNYHVIEGADQLIVTLASGKQVPGKVVGSDQRTDLAVIKVNESGLQAAAFGDSDKVKVGEMAIAIGNPLGAQFASTVTVGVISAVNRSVNIDERRCQLLQTDAAINPGNSGGALVNSRGEVIGINSIKIVDVNVEGLNFAIPSDTVKPIVEAIIKQGKVVRPWVGILGGDVTPGIAEQFNLSVNTGVLVSELPEGSPAARAGIEAGDVIVRLGGTEVKEFADLRSILDKRKIGDTVEIEIVRGKEKKTITMKLEQMPD